MRSGSFAVRCRNLLVERPEKLVHPFTLHFPQFQPTRPDMKICFLLVSSMDANSCKPFSFLKKISANANHIYII